MTFSRAASDCGDKGARGVGWWCWINEGKLSWCGSSGLNPRQPVGHRSVPPPQPGPERLPLCEGKRRSIGPRSDGIHALLSHIKPHSPSAQESTVLMSPFQFLPFEIETLFDTETSNKRADCIAGGRKCTLLKILHYVGVFYSHRWFIGKISRSGLYSSPGETLHTKVNSYTKHYDDRK